MLFTQYSIYVQNTLNKRKIILEFDSIYQSNQLGELNHPFAIFHLFSL